MQSSSPSLNSLRPQTTKTAINQKLPFNAHALQGVSIHKVKPVATSKTLLMEGGKAYQHQQPYSQKSSALQKLTCQSEAKMHPKPQNVFLRGNNRRNNRPTSVVPGRRNNNNSEWQNAVQYKHVGVNKNRCQSSKGRTTISPTAMAQHANSRDYTSALQL